MMNKYVFAIMTVVIMTCGCQSQEKKVIETATPLIEKFVKEQRSHPETYKSLETMLYREGDVNVNGIGYYSEEPRPEKVEDIYIFKHIYQHRSRQMELITDTVWVFVPKEIDIVYGAMWWEDQVEGLLR